MKYKNTLTEKGEGTEPKILIEKDRDRNEVK